MAVHVSVSACLQRCRRLKFPPHLTPRFYNSLPCDLRITVQSLSFALPWAWWRAVALKTSSCTDQQKQMSMPNASSCTDENLTAQASSRHPTLHLILRPDDHVPSTSRTGPSQLGPALLWFAGPRPFKKRGEYIFRPQSSRDNKSIQ